MEVGEGAAKRRGPRLRGADRGLELEHAGQSIQIPPDVALAQPRGVGRIRGRTGRVEMPVQVGDHVVLGELHRVAGREVPVALRQLIDGSPGATIHAAGDGKDPLVQGGPLRAPQSAPRGAKTAAGS